MGSANPKRQPLKFKPDPEFTGHSTGVNDGEVRIAGIVLARWQRFKKF